MSAFANAEVASQVEGADIVFSAGLLRYIEQPDLADMISSFKLKPKHILINITPVYEGPSLITLQNVGAASCPYRIFTWQEFISSQEKQENLVSDGILNIHLIFLFSLQVKTKGVYA